MVNPSFMMQLPPRERGFRLEWKKKRAGPPSGGNEISAHTYTRVRPLAHTTAYLVTIPTPSFSSLSSRTHPRAFSHRETTYARCHVRTASPLAFSVRFFLIFLLFSFPSALSYVRDTRSCNISDIARVRAEIIFASKDRTRLRRACNPSSRTRSCA